MQEQSTTPDAWDWVGWGGPGPGAEAGLTRCLEGPGFKRCSQTSVMPTAKGWGHREALRAELRPGHCSCRTEQGAGAETGAWPPGSAGQRWSRAGQAAPIPQAGDLPPPSLTLLTPVCLCSVHGRLSKCPSLSAHKDTSHHWPGAALSLDSVTTASLYFHIASRQQSHWEGDLDTPLGRHRSTVLPHHPLLEPVLDSAPGPPAVERITGQHCL